MMDIDGQDNKSILTSILYWPHTARFGLVRIDSRNKKYDKETNEQRNQDINTIDYESRIKSGWYDSGVAIRLGWTIGHQYYGLGVDLDGWHAVKAWFGGNTDEETWKSVTEYAKQNRLEWHQDRTRLHLFYYLHEPTENTIIPLPDDNQIEIRGEGQLLCVSPSIAKDGNPFTAMNSEQIPIVQNNDVLQSKIKAIFDEHLSSTGNNSTWEWLHNPNTIFGIGKGRHNWTVWIVNSYFWKWSGQWLDLTDEQRFERAWQWHLDHCRPPRSREEFDRICTDVKKKYCKDRDTKHEEVRRAAPEGKTNIVKTKTATQMLVELVTKKSDLMFQDQYGVPCIRIKVGDHYEVMFIQNSKFRHYINGLYFDSQQAILCRETLNDVANMLAGRALYGGSIIDLNLRVAWAKKNEEIHYDLTDPKWRCVKITKDGWSIIPHTTNTMFTRFNQKSQVEPDRNYQDNILDKFIDMMHINNPEQRILIKVWIVSAFIPDFPHPIDVLHGEKGSLKSTLCRYKKRLIDPDRIELLTIPKDKPQFVQQLYHNYLAVYENVRHIPGWFSDEVCRAITGAGNTKRGLYTNDEDIIYNYKRLIMVNGINNVLTEPDALDRCLLDEFDRIKPEQRREEADVDIEFEEIRPKILGFILDTLVKVLVIKDTVKLSNLPRMADFAAWGETIARALGYKELEFINAYYNNIGKQNVEVIENNPLAQALDKFVDMNYEEGKKSACWYGTMKAGFEFLNKVAVDNNIDTDDRGWPKASNSLSRRLKAILSNLREGLGVDIMISRATTGDKKRKNTSTLTVRKISPLPPLPPPDENQVQNQGESGGDTSSGGGIISAMLQVSPPEHGQSHVQNVDSVDSGDRGGICGKMQVKPWIWCPEPYCGRRFETTEDRDRHLEWDHKVEDSS